MAKEIACKHCSKAITWSSVMGWYHGVMGAGWNTTCENGYSENRAEPNSDILYVSEEDKEKMADAIQTEAKFTSWDYVHYNRESALDIVDTFIKAGWQPNND